MQKYSNNVTNRGGQSVSGASVSVTTLAGGGATIYSDNGVTTRANPIITDSQGEFSFYAANERYTVTITGSNIDQDISSDIILYDRADDPSPTSAALAASGGAGLVGVIQSGAGAVANTVEAELRRSYFVGQFSTSAQAVIAAAGHRLFVNDGESITVSVPSQFATIALALAAIRDWVISSNGTVTIQVADGTYALTSGLTLNHPFGSRVRLVGNETTPGNCVIEVAGSGFDCFVATNGNVFGYLNGFKFYKTVKALAADNSTAILAHNGARIICGPKIVVDNWYYAIAARNGSFILSDYAQVDHAGDVGIWSFNGSTISAQNAVSNNALDSANGLGFGFQAEYGSTLECGGAQASGCNIAGIAALYNSTVRAHGSTASNNTGSGLYATGGSLIVAHGATVNNNTRYGVEQLTLGSVYANSITATGNTLGAGVSASFQASGPGANIDTIVASKGAALVQLQSNGSTAFQVNNVSASAVNFGQVDGSISGSSVDFKARGADTNIDMGLSPKGSGVVKFGAFSANADAPITGYITIKDSGGTLRKIAVIA